MADTREPEFARPKFVNAVRTANRRRQADRPEEPKDMNFEEYISLKKTLKIRFVFFY